MREQYGNSFIILGTDYTLFREILIMDDDC